ncbi:MAG: cupin domain-containing protein [Gaiellales bacterium]
MSDRAPHPRATLAPHDGGLTPVSDGWYVLNVADAPTYGNEHSGTFFELESDAHRWPHLGVNVHVLAPGQASCRYHGENQQEDFLVLHGECLVVVEEQERRLRQWDLVHCPPWTRHVFVGAGTGPCAILMVGRRLADEELLYPVSEAAGRYGASVSLETPDPAAAYAEWPGPWVPTRTSWPLD